MNLILEFKTGDIVNLKHFATPYHRHIILTLNEIRSSTY